MAKDRMREIYIFGIRFLDGTFQEIRQELDRGGVMVVPAAPALATICEDEHYHASLKESRFAIFDSGLLCLLLLVFKGVSVRRISGLDFLRLFLRDIVQLQSGTVFLIDPTPDDSDANRTLITKWGYTLETTHQYLAPMYSAGEISDPRLLRVLRELRPRYIILNLGGGVQERLAIYLSKQLDSYAPSIICTGAAIAFLTGRQAAISPIMDRLYLGWLVRCLTDYRRFVPRYLRGFKLIPMIMNETLKENRL
ncbi:MAG: hypothetical protein EPO19_04290 [Betaproteobacteria bacterium]|nr:MAG: hypothetical protein EPO19_04290 [Betaproteobacteria bacterium]